MSPQIPQPVRLATCDGAPALLLDGVVNILAADVLAAAAREIEARGESTLVECARAEHLDTSALQILLALASGLERRGKTLRMVRVSPGVEAYVRLAGLERLLERGSADAAPSRVEISE